MNPKMPKGGIRETITVTVRLMMDPERYSSGSIGMRISDAAVKIVEGEEKIGEICACLGGGIQIDIGDRSWGIDPLPLWKAVREADEEYLKECESKSRQGETSNE